MHLFSFLSAADLPTFPICTFISILITVRHVVQIVSAEARSLLGLLFRAATTAEAGWSPRIYRWALPRAPQPHSGTSHTARADSTDGGIMRDDESSAVIHAPSDDTATSAADSKPPDAGTVKPGCSSIACSLTSSCLSPFSFLLSEAANLCAIFGILPHAGFYISKIQPLFISP